MATKIPPPLPSGNPEKRNNGVQTYDSKITYWFIPPEIGALQIPLLQKNILGVVATFTRNGGECWATDTQFGEAFQWSRQKVNAAINGMVSAGFLQKDVTRLSNGMTPRRLWIAQPLVTLSPTVTTSTIEPMDLVTHGDYPCHLERLPLSPTVTTLVTHGDTNSNIIKKEKVIKNTVADAPSPTFEFPLSLKESEDSDPLQESDSLEKPIEISEAPPLPAAPPKVKKAKQPESGWPDVQAVATPEQWESIEMWRKHRTQMKKPCTPLSIMQNLKKYGSDLSAAIEHSIEKGWQGIFSPSRNGTDTKEPLTAGLTDKEIDLRLDFIWAHYKNSPIIPVRPFKDLAEENFVIDVLRSVFGDDYEEAIKKRRTDEKSFYQSAFRNKYKQGVESAKV